MHRDLLSALRAPRGLILVAGPTGHGKTTAIERALADPACPPNVTFAGDLCDADAARRAASAGRSTVVIAVLGVQRAASTFMRLIDMGVPAIDVADLSCCAFSTRLFRAPDRDARPTLLHERLLVTRAIRSLIIAGADSDAIHRRAIAEGMLGVRQAGLELVRAGRLTREAVVYMTPDDAE